ncbi:MAG: hypothetical protein DVS81_15480 [Candidatus Accumulibacter meliphilus]|uniref:Uncharacterized protein n=1 Tax=Candidatus Accumulibacter meliphilus TaxID=2211374 RepID=A0A369XLA0_9PROT|nr:MAG: hypothetical protein DVS81_15480 [Candidatus Accumulibacter meliphilus]
MRTASERGTFMAFMIWGVWIVMTVRKSRRNSPSAGDETRSGFFSLTVTPPPSLAMLKLAGLRS